MVWSAIGAGVEHYIEPFFGSGAVLLKRPRWNQKLTETVNDASGFVCNAWRGIQFNPDEVARWCDWPVNHADLMARKKRLIKEEGWLLKNLVEDDKWCDSELAGYWIWCASSWIGDGMRRLNQIPNIGSHGEGVHALSRRNRLQKVFQQLSNRLRHVRVVCGDWKRVCGGDWQDTFWNTVGMFFDPPYGVEDRSQGIYEKDNLNTAKELEAWCLERGDRKNYRIVIAGYDIEYKELVAAGWTTHQWKAQGGYSNIAKSEGTQGSKNKYRETLFFSPHCLKRKPTGFGLAK